MNINIFCWFLGIVKEDIFSDHTHSGKVLKCLLMGYSSYNSCTNNSIWNKCHYSSSFKPLRIFTRGKIGQITGLNTEVISVRGCCWQWESDLGWRSSHLPSLSLPSEKGQCESRWAKVLTALQSCYLNVAKQQPLAIFSNVSFIHVFKNKRDYNVSWFLRKVILFKLREQSPTFWTSDHGLATAGRDSDHIILSPNTTLL